MPNEKTLHDGEELNKKPIEGEDPEDKTPEGDDPEDKTPKGEDFVPPTEEEFNKVKEDRDNYKKGMLKAKGDNKEDKKASEKSEFVTKADMQKDRETQAIKEVLAENPEMDTEWTKFVGYIPKVSSSDDLDSIKKKIKAGYAGYKSTIPEGEGDDKDLSDKEKKAKADLAKTKGPGGTTPPPPKKDREKILKTSKKGMESWYPEPEA